MKEIRFRGLNNYGIWCFGYYQVDKHGQHIIHMADGFQSVVRAETVGQYTGQHDSRSKDLYVGDICEIGIKTTAGWLKKIGVMKWWEDESRFSLQFDMDDSWGVEGEATPPVRIGNIYENPELLQESSSGQGAGGFS